MLITQYEGSLVEHVGMLKMDFLGLKTLTIIKNTIKLIKKHHNIDIDINKIDLNDKRVLSTFALGNTIGVFQFESEGMRAWLKKLQPDCIEDLIAMNALFRPGPMQFIDDFIKRKHGQQKIEYPHPLLEDILKNTYGIIVYQEQVMQVAQVIAGYSLGQADILRKAMGKKKPEEMAKQKKVFIEGCLKTHNIEEKQATDIFSMMETFAQYGFNKAHAAAYSVIAFQTAFLKTYYPKEFMVASLINAQINIESLTPLIQDCQRMKIKIKGPSVNESNYDFDINENGEICYGLAGVKGVGDAAANCIIETRENHGEFKDIFDFVENVDLRTINKKTLEALALSGGLDCLNSGCRRQYLYVEKDLSFIERLIAYVGELKRTKEEMLNSLFGEMYEDNSFSIPKPQLPECDEYSNMELLSYEKTYVGFYISGHPLEIYRKHIEHYCNCNSRILNTKIEDLEDTINYEKTIIAGIITKVNMKLTKNDTQYAIVTIEDFEGELNFSLFGKVFTDNKNLLNIGEIVFCIGRVENKYNDPNKNEFKCSRIFKILEIYRKYIEHYCNCNSRILNTKIEDLNEEVNYEKTIIAGIITKVNMKLTKNDTQYAIVTIEDFEGEINFSLFGESFTDNKNLLDIGEIIFCIKCSRIFKMLDIVKRGL